MRTNELKELIQTKLKTVTTNVYFNQARDTAMYPHIVFYLKEIDLNDLSRQDYTLEVHVWTKGSSTTGIDDLADSVEDLLQAKNLPQDHILPTFYKRDRHEIEDPDKTIQHRRIRFQVQNYVR